MKKVLVTGATGYVGGRLLGELMERGCDVRAVVRRPEYFRGRLEGVEVVQGDLLEGESLKGIFDGIEVAYYLVHLLGAKEGEFEELEMRAAKNFAESLKGTGVKKVIYLGGIARGEGLSAHLQTRKEVGEILRSSGVPVLEFQASIILGRGSFSYEMMRALVEKLPVMVAPRWIGTKAQPIFIGDVLKYLVEGAENDLSGVYEIGGATVATYYDLMMMYARLKGLTRYILTLKVLTPRLSSLWLGLVTPVYARIGRKLIDSLVNDTYVENGVPEKCFSFQPRTLEESLRQCIASEQEEIIKTRWCDALSSQGVRVDGKFGQELTMKVTTPFDGDREKLFQILEEAGGKKGWFFGNTIWKIRGALDIWAGGVGMRKRRVRGKHLAIGDVVDFWRVEDVVKNERIVLRSEMKMPGRAYLVFEIDEKGFHQTAVFEPLGLSGVCYWWSLYPVHVVLFRGMAKKIVKLAHEQSGDRKGTK